MNNQVYEHAMKLIKCFVCFFKSMFLGAKYCKKKNLTLPYVTWHLFFVSLVFHFKKKKKDVSLCFHSINWNILLKLHFYIDECGQTKNRKKNLNRCCLKDRSLVGIQWGNSLLQIEIPRSPKWKYKYCFNRHQGTIYLCNTVLEVYN